MDAEITYSFKEFWEDRFNRLTKDLEKMDLRLDSIERVQVAHGEKLIAVSTRMTVLGSLGLLLGPILAAAILKGLGI